MLALPLVAMLALVVLSVVGVVRTYLDAAATAGEVAVTLAVQDLVHELQRERGLTNGLLGGESRYRADVDAQRRHADDARARLDRLIADESTPGTAAVRGALSLLDDQGTIRGSVDAGSADRTAVFDSYTAAINALNSQNIGFDETADAGLRHHLGALRALGDAKEAAAKERGFLNGVFAAGRFRQAATSGAAGADEYARFADIRAAKRAALARFDQEATAQQRALADAALRSVAAVRAAGYEEAAVAAADGRALQVEPRSWWDSMTTLVDDLRAVQQKVGVDARVRAGELQRRAAFQLAGLLALALLALVGEGLLLVNSARSITRPLAELAREAEDVASRRLPEAVARLSRAHSQTASQEQPDEPPPVLVPARAGAEIRLVAQALDRVQQVAHTLAAEQALLRRNTTASLANLGRRNQNLVRRQLSFISQLEREEPDPSALANLFELDHLATRMRRNAESLLVLVGEASPRRWSTPLAVADVIRAALAEVEEYRRVELRRIDDAYLAGSAATDVAHMIAELVENGLAFSPPELDVEIYGRWTGTRYLIAIVDQGVGMSNAELDQANARLRGEENFLIGPARFLGHYVVGRLAQELGAPVELAHSPVTGITARLVLPAGLLAASADIAGPAAAGLVATDTAVAPDAAIAAGAAAAAIASAPAAQDQAAGSSASGVASTAELPLVTPLPLVTAQAATAVRAAAGRPGPGWDSAPGAAPVPAPPSGPDRTRNGLVKRLPRAARTVPSGGAGGAPTPAGTVQTAAADRRPDDVRSMLSAFRAGTQRGESRSATSRMSEE
ncbi:hypothetical protein CS0771_45720 [Catellatospora sp. IY07-71]|nr:hypothetical protein CS0771_45720 [Catellatospora sp. IY07-71]